MSEQSTNLQLPFLQAGQAQKHVTVNESLLLFDALVQLAATSATVTAQPASPADGSVYILPVGKTGTDWGPMANNALAYYRDGAWTAIAPREGFTAWCKDSDKVLVFNGTTWGDLGVAGAPAAFAYSGDISPPSIGADQHDYNPSGLASASVMRVSSDARRAITGIQGGADGRVLFIANVGANPITLANAATASSAANRFAMLSDVELSPDSIAKLLYDATTQRWRLVSLATPGCVIDEFTASGAWTKRAGATFVDVTCIGGGGGGGGGARTASGNASSGGGGGGGGSLVKMRYTAAALGATMSVTVSAGGAGGAGATINGNAGGNGVAGGNSSFGSLLIGYGGGLGAGGQLAANAGGGGGAGPLAVGSNASGSTAGAGFGSVGSSAGGSGATGAIGAFGGGGGGGGTNAAAGATGGASFDIGSGGGGAGGGIATTPANTAGGASLRVVGVASNTAGGASAAGSAGTLSENGCFGNGGGGGGSNASGAGYDGGAGALGGGGGGGGSAVGGNGGAGGAGGAGYVRVVTWF